MFERGYADQVDNRASIAVRTGFLHMQIAPPETDPEVSLVISNTLLLWIRQNLFGKANISFQFAKG